MKSLNLGDRLKSRIPALYYRRIREAASEAERLGLEAYLVGGVVRDLLLKKPFSKDCDLLFAGGNVAPLAETLAARWKLRHSQYPAFGTHTLLSRDGFHMDIITARSETYAKPAALPAVKRGALSDDLKRRDFTVNAMAVALSAKKRGTLIDLHGGLTDLQKKKIRILHDKSFSDDPTRIFRAARYAGRFGFSIEPGTQKYMDDALRRKLIQELSADRVRTEIEKLLAEESPADALALLHRWKALAAIHPKLGWNSSVARWLGGAASPKEAKKRGIQSVIALRMALMVASNSRMEAESIIDALHFTKEVRDRITQPLEWIEAFRNEAPIQSIPSQTVFPESVCVMETLTRGDDPLKLGKSWVQLQKWQASAPEMTGRDLQKMGINPGPVYREILVRLRLQKFRGVLKSRKDEIRFVFDNYRRN